jgi:hypothetical protein
MAISAEYSPIKPSTNPTIYASIGIELLFVLKQQVLFHRSALDGIFLRASAFLASSVIPAHAGSQGIG